MILSIAKCIGTSMPTLLMDIIGIPQEHPNIFNILYRYGLLIFLTWFTFLNYITLSKTGEVKFLLLSGLIFCKETPSHCKSINN